MAQKNAIAARLEILSDDWGEFALDGQARVLCWRLRANEPRMVEAFLAMEQDERAGEHPDVFLSFETPFENPEGHGYLLRKELVNAFREQREQLAADGVDAGWEPPQIGPDERDVPFFVRTCTSFAEHLKLPRHLALVLRPKLVSDPHAYQVWLQRWALAAPARQRVLLLDDERALAYAALCNSDPKRVWARAPALDMPGALGELSKEGGNLETPGGQYRDLFVRMANALGEQDIAAASAVGELALAVAAGQQWFHMAVPIQLALGSALAAAGRYHEAIARYLAAEVAAGEGEQKGAEELRPTCKLLRMQTRMSRGSALIAGGAWGMAAKLYEETIPIAVELGDARSTLDCHRLASFCHEQSGNADEAWRIGMPGLAVARDMDEDTRKTSTFAYLGEGLMRLAQAPARRSAAAQLEREIVAIAGTRDWRPRPVASASVNPAGAPT